MNAIKTSLLASAVVLALGASAAQAHEDKNKDMDKERAEHNSGWDKNHYEARPVRTAGQVATDAAITASVKTRLLASDRAEGFDINVDTYNGVVTLVGGADTLADKLAAGLAASEAENVVDVMNKVIVAPEGTERRLAANSATASGEVRESMDDAGDEINDAWIASKVKTQLLADDEVHGTDINVDVVANVVTLTGTAPTLSARTKAVAIAQATEGVRSVVATGLVVGPGELVDEDGLFE